MKKLGIFISLLLASMLVYAAGFKDFSWDELRFGGSASGVRKITFDQNPDGSSAEISVDPANEEINLNNNVNLGGSLDVTTTATVGTGVTVTAGNVELTNGVVKTNSSTDSSRPCPPMTTVERDLLTPADGDCVYNEDTGNPNFYDATAMAWKEAGGSGLGGINYIENHDIELNTDGYSTYADAAGVSPEDGTGGSPLVLVQRNLTNPLRGDADLELVKDAANRQGEGFSYDFTIDSADTEQELTVSFDFDATDANYTSNDIGIFIYDVVGAALIPLNTSDLPKSKDSFTAQFTATVNTDYRIIWHIRTVSATSFSIFFDNITVGPQVNGTTLSQKGDIQTHDGVSNERLALGLNGEFLVVDTTEPTGLKYTASLQGKLNPITDPQSYTPTNTQGFGTISNNELQYHREGKFLVIKGSFTTGTNSASEAQVELPNSYVVDSSYTRLTNVGTYTKDITASGKGGLVYATGGDTYLNFSPSGVFSGTSINPYQAAAGNGVTNSNIIFSFEAKVPIQGWTSGLDAAVQDVEKTMFNSDLLSAYMDGNSPSLSSRENFDGWIVGNSCSRSGTSIYTCTHPAGLFTSLPTCWGAVEGDYVNTTSVNIISQTLTSTVYETTGTGGSFAGAHTLYCSKASADVNKSQVIAGTFENINSSDLVVVEAESNNSEVLSASYVTNIPFIETKDDQNTWNGSEFTAPKDGIYTFSGGVRYNSSVGTPHFRIAVNKGSGYVLGKSIAPVGVTGQNGYFNSSVHLEAGDKAAIRGEDPGTLEPNTITHNLVITQSADYESIVKNLYNEKKECQTKYLQSSTSSTGVKTDLSFNNLDLTKKYSIQQRYSVSWTTTGVGVNQLILEYGNGDDISFHTVGGQHNTGNNKAGTGVSIGCLEPTQTSLQFNLSNSNSTQLLGSGDYRQTYVELCELPPSTICNSNKWD